ncbi:hypothetical protein A2U01_0098100 [Trifolium medium]|nr:hypothetical protein [Trifolium medium]
MGTYSCLFSSPSSCIAKYNTKPIKMDLTLEQENHKLHEEVTALRAQVNMIEGCSDERVISGYGCC